MAYGLRSDVLQSGREALEALDGETLVEVVSYLRNAECISGIGEPIDAEVVSETLAWLSANSEPFQNI